MTSVRVALGAGLVVLAQVLDSVVVNRFAGLGGSGLGWVGLKPDLTLLVVVAFALLGGPRAGAVVGLAAGLLTGLVPPGPEPLGVAAIGYGLAGAVAGRWHRPGEWSLLLALVAAGCAALVAAGTTSAVAVLAGGLGAGQALGVVGSSGLACVFGAVLVVPLVRRLDRAVVGELPEAVRW
jgi:cell shape-determining protein MreD